MEQSPYVCPLLSIGNERGAYCIKDSCAWYSGTLYSCCALAGIAMALDCISDGIEIIHREPKNEKGE